jgi:N-acetylneuraminic acid mutarotase
MPDFVEPLEPRQLLAGDFAAKVNFQPGSADIPDGYLADAGQTFGARRGGLSFGWDANNQAGARERDHSRSPDQRFDTLNHLRPGNDWEIAVPDGAYEVRLVAGDARYFNSVHKISVENVLVIDSVPTSRHRFSGGVAVVNVSDGRLTISSAPGGENNKVNFVELRQVDPPTSTPAQPDGLSAHTQTASKIELTWDDVDGETGYRIERKRGTSPFKPVAIVAANDTSYVDAQLKSGTKYTYRLRAFNAAGGSGATGTKSARTLQTTGTQIAWTEVAPSPIVRAEALRAVVGDKLYVLGGFQGSAGPVARSDVYDPATDTWTRIADMPERLTHAGVTSLGRDIYVAGGYVGIDHPTNPFEQQFGTTDVWRFNVDTQQWTEMPDLPEALASGGLVALNGKLHYFGGNDSSRNDVGDHYVLDLNDLGDGWTSAASLPNPRSHFGYAMVDGKIYVLAGQSDNDEDLTTTSAVHVRDPASPGAWQPVASAPANVSHISSSTFEFGNRILVAGGESDHEAPVASVRAFDQRANTWTTLTSLPAARFSGVAAAIDGIIYFTTGSSQTTTWRGVFVG